MTTHKSEEARSSTTTERIDSTVIRDSVLILIRKDTVIKERWRTEYRERWRDRVIKDTVRITDTTTVQKETFLIPNEKKPQRDLSNILLICALTASTILMIRLTSK